MYVSVCFSRQEWCSISLWLWIFCRYLGCHQPPQGEFRFSFSWEHPSSSIDQGNHHPHSIYILSLFLLLKSQKGRMIFTQPQMPIKCAGATQKIMWLADDYTRSQGTRVRTNVTVDIFFSTPKYSRLMRLSFFLSLWILPPTHPQADTEIYFALPQAQMFGIPKYSGKYLFSCFSPFLSSHPLHAHTYNTPSSSSPP